MSKIPKSTQVHSWITPSKNSSEDENAQNGEFSLIQQFCKQRTKLYIHPKTKLKTQNHESQGLSRVVLWSGKQTKGISKGTWNKNLPNPKGVINSQQITHQNNYAPKFQHTSSISNISHQSHIFINTIIQTLFVLFHIFSIFFFSFSFPSFSYFFLFLFFFLLFYSQPNFNKPNKYINKFLPNLNSTHIKVRMLPTFYGKTQLIQQHKIEGSRKTTIIIQKTWMTIKKAQKGWQMLTHSQGQLKIWSG